MQQRIQKPQPQNILLIQLRQLGDILLTSPCPRAIKAKYPDARITFLSHHMGQTLLERNPFIDRVITYHEDHSWRETLALWRTLRNLRFDLVIDWMNNPRSALFTLATGAPLRCSFRQRLFAAYTSLDRSPEGQTYIVERKFSLLRHLGFLPQDIRLIFQWHPEDLGPYQQLLRTYTKFREAPLRIVLSATHRRSQRKWPTERYVRLAERLIREWNASVTWIWGPGGEEQEIDALIAQCQETTYKSPATTLPELVALLAHHDLFIGNSNGPSHLAVAADISTLHLCGESEAWAWCPDTLKHQSLQSPEFGKVALPTLKALREEEVWAKLQTMKPIIAAQAARRIACSSQPEKEILP